MSMTDIAKASVDALKSSPLLLVVILLNVIFACAALFYLRAEQRQVDSILSHCLPHTEGTPK